MPQVLKAENRSRIVKAATEAFAAQGYQKTTMAAIAKRAKVSTGNLYRYYRSKEALFAVVVDDDFVARFEALLERRVAALGTLDHLQHHNASSGSAEHEMLEFWIAHRLAVVVLLDRCAGTRHADFGARFAMRLVDLAEAQILAETGMQALPEVVRFTLTNIFDAARRSIVSILERYSAPDDIRNAFAAFWSFQLAGLEGFKKGILAT